MKNTFPADGAAFTPRGLVKVNGEVMPGWLRISTEENTFSQADTFSVSFGLSDLPEARGARWWSEQIKAEVEIFMGFPEDPLDYTESDLTSVFTGVVDDVDMDFDGTTLEVSGRDFSAPLMDNKTSEKYRNNTASEVAEKLAAKYGLTPKVTATTTKIGRYYADDHVDLKDARTEWDLITWLAQQEGFIVFTRGRELHFRKPPEASQDPYVVNWRPATEEDLVEASVMRLRCTRSLTVAKGIEVTVRSWNTKQKKAFTRKAKRGGDDVQKYSYSVPGLTPDEAQQLANKKRDEISKHEMKIDFSGPADGDLQIDDVILLQGTDTAFDQVYFPDSISRTMTDQGYDIDVSAKNHSPESEPTL